MTDHLEAVAKMNALDRHPKPPRPFPWTQLIALLLICAWLMFENWRLQQDNAVLAGNCKVGMVEHRVTASRGY